MSAAALHAGRKFTLSCDVEGFFDHVTPERVAAGSAGRVEVSPHTVRFVGAGYPDTAPTSLLFPAVAPTGQPHAAQGLPTSPALADIAGVAIDREVRARLGAFDYVYTRYVDDLTVSYDQGVHAELREVVRQAVECAGFQLAERKTQLQWARVGRRVICGVAVDADGSLHATRRTRRRLRAARHQDPRSGQTRGLTEWCRMRPPRQGDDRLDWSVTVWCGGQVHRVSTRADGGLVFHNHGREIAAAGGLEAWEEAALDLIDLGGYPCECVIRGFGLEVS